MPYDPPCSEMAKTSKWKPIWTLRQTDPSDYDNRSPKWFISKREHLHFQSVSMVALELGNYQKPVVSEAGDTAMHPVQERILFTKDKCKGSEIFQRNPKSGQYEREGSSEQIDFDPLGPVT